MSKVNNYNVLVPLMKEKKKYSQIYIYLIILITVILTGLRIIFYFISVETLSENNFLYIIIRNRDLNFRTLYDLMDNGIIHFYRENPITQDKALYLYFWYFFFYPFYTIPFEISIYIWDLLRLFSTIYIATSINKITEDQREISFFFLGNGCNNHDLWSSMFIGFFNSETNESIFCNLSKPSCSVLPKLSGCK